MARRRKSYGAIHLKSRSRKIARHRDRFQNGRSKIVGVKVYVQRGRQPTNYTSGEGYYAWACTAKPRGSGDRSRDYSYLAERRKRSCGETAYGRTPTTAIKKALVNLGRKRDLK